jgi:hypothetical protein
VKKAFLPLAIGLFLILTPSFVSAFSGETDVTSLNNKDVLTMVLNHVPEEAIIRTIKSSPCTFDTFPPVLKDLKRRGVPDSVLQAMVEAPYGPSTQATSTDELSAEDQPIYHCGSVEADGLYVAVCSRTQHSVPAAKYSRASEPQPPAVGSKRALSDEALSPMLRSLR